MPCRLMTAARIAYHPSKHAAVRPLSACRPKTHGVHPRGVYLQSVFLRDVPHRDVSLQGVSLRGVPLWGVPLRGVPSPVAAGPVVAGEVHDLLVVAPPRQFLARCPV